jgi:hypothetical protein
MNKKVKILIWFLLMCLSIVTNAQSKIAEFSGNGGKNTRPFIVNGPWEISWNATGSIFQLYLYDMNGDLIGLPANQLNAGKGSSYQVEKGKFYLQVNAMGNWSISINNATQKSESSTKLDTQSDVIAEFSGNGGKNTRPFTVEKPWELFWDASGAIFQLYLYDMDGNLIGLPANQLNAGKGSSFQVVKGKFYLQVNAMGNWNLKIKYAD